MAICQWLYQRLNRRKTIKESDMEKTNLSRCLTTLDLTALGIGSTLGAGVYVISGEVARSEAGPAVVISFLIAALASILAGLCYAEFGARVPKAGSAYIYTYVSIGEFMAFVIGWNLLLEYVIGAASLARAASGYIDGIIGDDEILVKWFRENVPLNIPTFAESLDLLAIAIPFVLTIFLVCGVKESVTLNKVFTGINLSILCYVMGTGLFLGKASNWFLSQEQVLNETLSANMTCTKEQEPGDCGEGGFAPYGVAGIIKGAATCFYAFIGFDVIATTGEEARNPQRSIPLATILSLTIIFFTYFGVSTTITMMAPYYALSDKAPFAKLFVHFGWKVAKYVVSIGAICALTTSLLGAMFPLPRVVLAMARDGLFFKYFAKVSERVKIPTRATIFSGILAVLLAAVFDINALVEMMSIGTLLAYTLVATSVMILRYDVAPEDVDMVRDMASTEATLRLKNDSIKSNGSYSLDKSNSLSNFNLSKVLSPKVKYPTTFSAQAVKVVVVLLLCCIVSLCFILNFFAEHLFQLNWLACTMFAINLLICSFFMYVIGMQPESCKKLFFKVPLVNIVPAISIAINVFLMINLSFVTWIRFGVWMALGLSIYFGYGIRHSSEEEAYRNRGTKIDDYTQQPTPTLQKKENDPQCALTIQVGFEEVKL